MKDSMKILLAFDGSDYGLSAVDEAARIPWPADSKLRVISVAELPAPVMSGPMPMPASYFEEWEKALEDQAVANTATALSRYYEQGGTQIDVDAKSVKGNPKDVLLDEAEGWGADLIIIGTHGYNAFERMWLGSVSRTVASHARCSVQIVRQRRNACQAMKILLAVDGSPCSDDAVEEVATRPWPEGTEVRVITAVHLPFVPSAETWSLPQSYYAEVERVGREKADEFLDRAITRLASSNAERKSGLTLTREPILGHAEDVIIEEARKWEADLVVLGSHGYRGINRFILGSVSQAVAYHAPCSVEIVRRREEQSGK